jgi:ABC-type transport system involved in cytochrome bd biosynthesis fused ATPase/permease subunit
VAGGSSLGIERVTVSYGPAEPMVLQDAGLRIDPGEQIALIGASGAGKTTLVRANLLIADPAAAEDWLWQVLETVELDRDAGAEPGAAAGRPRGPRDHPRPRRRQLL